MKGEDVLHEILRLTQAARPDQLRRAELLTMRASIVKLVTDALTDPERLTPILDKRNPSRNEAIEIVLAYDGDDRFLLDLKRTIGVYGGLTEGQREAVLRTPSETERAELEEYGYNPSEITYAWQAIELIRRGRREARRRAREEAAT